MAGTWRPRRYVLAAGAELPVDGRISFRLAVDDETAGEWLVLFFVTDGSGNPIRGSAEGGNWSREANSLMLTHTYHLSAGEPAGPLPAAPLRLALRSAAEAWANHREPCEVLVTGGELTLFFPSGNSMTFERLEALGSSEGDDRPQGTAQR